MSILDFQSGSSERKIFRQILESSDHGILFAEPVVDWAGNLNDFRFRFINKTASEILDLSSAQVSGQTLSDLFQPEQAQSCFDRYSGVWNSGSDLNDEVFYELPNGRFWFRVRIAKAEEGVIIFFDDITMEKQVGADQLAFDRLKEALLHNPSAALWVKNLEGQYTFINRGMRDLLGLRFWQILGKSDQVLFPGPIADRHAESDKEVIESRGPVSFLQKIPIGSRMKTFVTHKFPVFGSSGELAGVGGISTEASFPQV